MPIVTIQLVQEEASDISAHIVQSLADRLGRIFGTTAGETWVRVTHLARSQYAENDVTVGLNVQSTFVEVLKENLPDEESMATEAKRIAVIVSGKLSRPLDNTHVLYLPPAAGRIAFGGELRLTE